MRTYTEKEVLEAIEYACNMQKAVDYQLAGSLLIKATSEDWEDKREELLNQLADTNNNDAKNIPIKEFNEYLDS